MALEDRIKNINQLNQEGVELTDSGKPNRYSLSMEKHILASALARNNPKDIENINPDYFGNSEANIAYDLRQMGQDRNFVLSFLENTLKTTENEFKSDKFTKSDFETFFGRARILEEMALVIRYKPLNDADLKGGIKIAKKSLDLYKKALDNFEYEIFNEEVIEDRLLRTTGIVSTLFLDLAQKCKGKEKEDYQKQSIIYADKELESRLDNGEKAGFNLMNAYHTSGAARAELVGKDRLMYKKAKDNLELAKDLAKKEKMQMELSVLTFELAWLEYRKNPKREKGEHYEKIGHYFHKVLDQQKTPAKWNPAVKDKLKERMFTLGNYLGKGSLIMLKKMYKS